MKLVVIHHLPLNCFQWEGLKLLLDPISTALQVTMNRKNIKAHLDVIACNVKSALKEELKGKLISIKIDSASRRYRHILGINAQYEINGEVVIRTLGKLWKIINIEPSREY